MQKKIMALVAGLLFVTSAQADRKEKNDNAVAVVAAEQQKTADNNQVALIDQDKLSKELTERILYEIHRKQQADAFNNNLKNVDMTATHLNGLANIDYHHANASMLGQQAKLIQAVTKQMEDMNRRLNVVVAPPGLLANFWNGVKSACSSSVYRVGQGAALVLLIAMVAEAAFPGEGAAMTAALGAHIVTTSVNFLRGARNGTEVLTSDYIKEMLSNATISTGLSAHQFLAHKTASVINGTYDFADSAKNATLNGVSNFADAAQETTFDFAAMTKDNFCSLTGGLICSAAIPVTTAQ